MTGSNIEVKNRDASDKYKGFRYQKIRLAIKMFEFIKLNSKNNIIAFPEFREDGYYISEDGKQTFEQNKAYSTDFSFNSIEVRKAIVNFLDNYFELKKDPYLNFIFFTNVNYKKERQSDILTKIKLKPLEKPILQYLVEKDFSDKLIEIVSKSLVQTYIEEYDIDIKKTDTYKGYYTILVAMKFKDWKVFLNQVTFQFGEGEIEEISQELEIGIKECEFYSIDHINKENTIRMCLLETIDERMAEKHVTQKIINKDNIKNIYHETINISSGLKVDGIYKYWEAVEVDEEQKLIRNLKEKINAVCTDFKKKTIERYSREAITVKDEIKQYDKRQIQSLRYRVHESMAKFFDEEYEYKNLYSFEELNEYIRKLRKSVVNDINSLMKNFDYGIKNDIAIEKIVLLLIDECFYSFEEE